MGFFNNTTEEVKTAEKTEQYASGEVRIFLKGKVIKKDEIEVRNDLGTKSAFPRITLLVGRRKWKVVSSNGQFNNISVGQEYECNVREKTKKMGKRTQTRYILI
mgnify:CR=1 FL=1